MRLISIFQNATAVLLIAGAPSASQEQGSSLLQESPLLCRVVRAISDINSDGIQEIATSGPLFSQGSTQPGIVLVLDGKTGAILQRWKAPPDVQRYGWKLGRAGDLDGDGHTELLVSTDLERGEGQVFAIAPRTNTQLFGKSGYVTAAWPLKALGQCLDNAELGDVDGDNKGEVFLIDVSTESEVQVIASADGKVERLEKRPPSIYVVDDLDEDGVRDWATLGSSPSIDVISSRSRQRIMSIALPPSVVQPGGIAEYYSFHESYRPVLVEDLDRDGVKDALIVSWEHSFCDGIVLAVSGKGNVLYELEYKGRYEAGEPRFGYAQAVPGDMDRDGVSDFVISAAGSHPSRIGAYSGRSGQVLWEVSETFLPLGVTLDLISDEDKDGIKELVVGCGEFDRSGPFVANGSIRILSGRTGDLLREFTESACLKQLGVSVTPLGPK